MPIINFKTKDEIPAELADVAQEIKEGDNAGQWSVNVVPRKKLDEFRDNNTAQAAKLEKAEGFVSRILTAVGAKSAEDFDIAKFTEEFAGLKDVSQKVADGKLKASDAIEAEVTKRTEAMREKFNVDLQAKSVELAAMRGERDAAVRDFKRTFIDRAVASVIADPDLGLEPTAQIDVINRAYKVFQVQDDNSLKPETENGQTLWGEDGTTPMSVKEWINIVLRKEAPHYFKKSNGGNANGGDNTKQFGGMTEAEFLKLPPERRLAIYNSMNTPTKR